jgi:hypothetical protein
LVKLHRWYKPQMVSVNRKTAALKLPTVQVLECNKQIWLCQFGKGSVERLALFVYASEVTSVS